MRSTTRTLLGLILLLSLSYAAPTQGGSRNEALKVAAVESSLVLSVESKTTTTRTSTVTLAYSTISTEIPAATLAQPTTAVSSQAIAPPAAQPSINSTAATPVGGPMVQPTQGGPPVLLSQLTAEQAGGSTPGGPPPQTSFSPNALANFRLANFIEGIESGFFAGALLTLKDDTTFTQPGPDGKSMANITTQIAAQELVHKATLEQLMSIAQQPAVPACTTILQVNNTKDFLSRANVVTAAAIGVIITILSSLATSNDNALVAPLSSILSVESQQDTFFRMSGNNTPAASPFSTGLSLAFAYNIALTFVDPRSCPQLIDTLPIFPSMNVTSPVVDAVAPTTPPTTLTFTASNVPQSDNLYIGWVNQANPVTYTNVTIQNGVGTAVIPPMTGLAFGALTAQNVAQTVDGLSNATIAGPSPVLMS